MQSLKLDCESLDRFCPAGSLSSHRDSHSESEEDRSHPAPLLLSPAAAFLPTSDNVIVFEVYTPASEAKFTFSEDQGKAVKPRRQGMERKEQSTMTEQQNYCIRHERQNAELRRELQSCTGDIIELDRAKARLTQDLQSCRLQLYSYEHDFMKLAELFDRLLDEDLLCTPPEAQMNSYVLSKAEILAARYTRLQSGYDKLVEDNARLRLDQEGGVGPQGEIVRQLNSRIKLKDRCILQLEQTLQRYKEKLTQLRDQDDLSLLPPSNKTENFSTRLQGLSLDSPAASPPTFPDSTTPCDRQDSYDEPHVPMATGESLNNTGKPTPVKSQGSKKEHVRTQSQSMFPVDKYQPVLLHRSRDTSFRSRHPSKAAPMKCDGLTPKQVPKSVSLDRKYQTRDLKSKIKPAK